MSSLVYDLERMEYCVGSRSWSRYWRTWFGLCRSCHHHFHRPLLQ